MLTFLLKVFRKKNNVPFIPFWNVICVLSKSSANSNATLTILGTQWEKAVVQHFLVSPISCAVVFSSILTEFSHECINKKRLIKWWLRKHYPEWLKVVHCIYTVIFMNTPQKHEHIFKAEKICMFMTASVFSWRRSELSKVWIYRCVILHYS